jgi:hypothetical protein
VHWWRHSPKGAEMIGGSTRFINIYTLIYHVSMAVAPTKRHKRIWPLIVVLPCTLAGQADWPTGLPLFPVVTFFHRGRKSRLSTGGINLWAGPSCHVPYISCTHPDYLRAVPTFRYFVFSGSRQPVCVLFHSVRLFPFRFPIHTWAYPLHLSSCFTI